MIVIFVGSAGYVAGCGGVASTGTVDIGSTFFSSETLYFSFLEVFAQLFDLVFAVETFFND